MVRLGKTGKATVRVVGKTFELETIDGGAIGNVSILIGGKLIKPENGKLVIPDAILQAAKTNGEVVVVVPGYLPQSLPLKEGAPISLVPLEEGGEGQVPAGGGTVTSKDKRLEVTLGPTMVGGSTDVTLNYYGPDLTQAIQDRAKAERDKLVADLGKGGCEAPLPCPPIASSLGLLVTANGELKSGSMPISYHLDEWLKGWSGTGTPPWEANPAGWTEQDKRFATAAARILKTFSQIDATGDAKWREALAERHGIRLDGRKLTFTVTVGDNVKTDGLVRVEVQGFAALGVLLEVTLMSAVDQKLPELVLSPDKTNQTPDGTTSTPKPDVKVEPLSESELELLSFDTDTLLTTGGMLIGNSGSTLIGNSGSTLIGNSGSTLIGNSGSTLIGNSGSTLIGNSGSTLIGNSGSTLIANNQGGSFTGEIRVPFQQEGAKYRVQAYTDYIWQGAQIRAVHGLGALYTQFVTADDKGRYNLTGLRYSMNGLFLQVSAGPYQLFTLARAPGKEQITADVNAATTAMSAVVIEAIAQQPVAMVPIKRSAFEAGVATLKTIMTQQDAEFVVSKPISQVAPYVRALLANNNISLGLFPRVETYAGTLGVFGMADGARATAQFDRPVGMVYDKNINVLYVADKHNNQVRWIDAAGTVNTLQPSRPLVKPQGLALDASDNLYITENGGQGLIRINKATSTVLLIAGSITVGGGTPLLKDPAGICMAPNGDVLVADYGAFQILRVTPTGTVTVVAGSPSQGYADGPASTAKFVRPDALAVDAAGNIFVADTDMHMIRKITPDGTVSTYAGTGEMGARDGLRTQAQFILPKAVLVDPQGNVLVADGFNHRIRKISPGGLVTTIAGSTQGAADGEGPNAKFNAPHGLLLTPDGTLYVTDHFNHAIRAIRNY